MTSAVLVRGANTAIDQSAVQVLVTWRTHTPVDPCAVLVSAEGKVRDDTDFVFYNQPQGASGAVALTAGDDRTARLDVDLARIPAEVTKVVIAGSMESGTFDLVPGLEVVVTGPNGRVLARFPVLGVERVAAIIFGELYRRDGQWKFRAIGQGWSSGLAGLATHYGVSIDDEPAPEETLPAPAGSQSPDWYPAPGEPALLRWWTGTEWSVQSTPVRRETETTCGRCGGAKQQMGGSRGCRPCQAEIANVLAVWRGRAGNILATSGPAGAAWDELRAELRFHRVPEAAGREALRPLALNRLQQVLTFAFADDIIEQHELDGFDEEARRLGIIDPAITEMRSRMQRGLDLGLIANGNVPRVVQTSLALNSGEILHLDTPAVKVRHLPNGTKRSSGRLVATNARLLFFGDGPGSDLPWAKVMEIRPEYSTVIVSTTAKGGNDNFEVDEPEHIAAVLTGVLKIAKQIAELPAQRDSRSVSPAVRVEVWRRDGGRCTQCEATEYLEFDHVIPWSRGGATSVGNLQLLCRRCNLAKGAQI